MAYLTGRPDGPPDFSRANVLGRAERIAVDAAALLTGRAALLGLTRGGRVSAGRATRLLAARDGWCAFTLSRPDDVAAVPALLHTDTPLSAAFSALTLDPAQYAPFRLLLVNRRESVAVHSDGTRIRLVWRIGLMSPQFFTSSGLGDQVVAGPRRQLFGEFFDPPGDWLARQDAFHRYRWPDRPHLSVCMDRQDARTVSHTVVCLGPDRVTLTYHPDAPDRPGEAIALTLPITDGGGA